MPPSFTWMLMVHLLLLSPFHQISAMFHPKSKSKKLISSKICLQPKVASNHSGPHDDEAAKAEQHRERFVGKM